MENIHGQEVMAAPTEKYIIELRGCDSSTFMELELSTSPATILEEVAKLSVQTSESRCDPTMHIQLESDFYQNRCRSCKHEIDSYDREKNECYMCDAPIVSNVK